MFFVFETEADVLLAIAVTGSKFTYNILDGRWITPYIECDESLLPTHTTEAESLTWYPTDSKEYVILRAAIEAGIDAQLDRIGSSYIRIKRAFVCENIIMGVTQAGKTDELLAAFKDVDYAMENYSVYAAIAVIDAIPRSTPFLTEERLSNFKQEILESV